MINLITVPGGQLLHAFEPDGLNYPDPHIKQMSK